MSVVCLPSRLVIEMKLVLALSGQLASVTGTLSQTLWGVEVLESERLPPNTITWRQCEMPECSRVDSQQVSEYILGGCAGREGAG